MRIALSVHDTGYCMARSNLIARGTGWHEVRCHAPAFLLQHPVHGACLFDTGYAPRITEAFTHWPDWLYGKATPTTLAAPVVQQLSESGIAPDAVRTVIVSHLHADHVAGLRDFPAASFVITRAALGLQRRATGLDAVRRGVLQRLMPPDFAERARVIEQFDGEAVPHLGATHDLFGDGSVRLVPLPGHARGQMGALVNTMRGEVLLCADGAWTTQAYRERRPPHWVTGAMQDDMSALHATLEALHDFALARPDVTILPTHCPDTLQWGRNA